MKGSKRHRWFKDGVHASRKYMKHVMNCKVRHMNNISSGCSYKRILKEGEFCRVD